MSLIDQIIKGKRITAEFLYDLAYGLANGDLDTTNNNLPFWRGYDVADHVMTGCTWTGDAYGSTRYASMTSGVVCIGGKVVVVDSVANRLFTASKDTYIDVDNTGALYYSEVANNAASPSLTAGRLRVAIIVTGASNIADTYSINQGLVARKSNMSYISNTDSLGNIICRRNPSRNIFSASRFVNSSTGGSASYVSWNGMNYIVFQAKPKTSYRFTMYEAGMYGMSGYGASACMKFASYLDTVANGAATQLGSFLHNQPRDYISINWSQEFHNESYSGTTYLNIKYASEALSGTATIAANASSPAVYTITEL